MVSWLVKGQIFELLSLGKAKAFPFLGSAIQSQGITVLAIHLPIRQKDRPEAYPTRESYL
jgi:hypothetical protein